MTLQAGTALDVPQLTADPGVTLGADTLRVSVTTEADLQELRAARWTQRRWEEWTVD
ncbi:hypothetical protein [Kineococcus sp. SYSU DK001]|uniref:hypothetical protein n=1 Tax=Kineococcus sp. SYSU DK001 TaxID=3383122 RepID=UPI003D7C57DF